MDSSLPRCLLIGNGFNRVPESDKSDKPPMPEWNALILLPLKKYHLKKDFFEKLKLSYPLKFECIVNYIHKEKPQYSASLYNRVKQDIIDELASYTENRMINKDIADALRAVDPEYIITTNYDCQLEKVFYHDHKNYKYPPSIIKRMEDRSTRAEEKVLDQFSKFKSTTFYHMHGINAQGMSSCAHTICLGYEHYTRIICLLRSLIGKPEEHKIRNMLEGNDAGNEIRPTYLGRFFDSNVDIIGLGLDEQEIDLWWILCYRAYLWFSNIDNMKEVMTNRIRYYDIHQHKTTDEGYSYEEDYIRQKKELFEYMHVEYVPKTVENKDFKSKYIEALEEIKNS